MAVDAFLKIDGIDGESSDLKHKNEIDILSFSWGESNGAAGAHVGGGGGAGKVSVQDFSFTAKVNKSSPKLFLSCATGEHFKFATLGVRKGGSSGDNVSAATIGTPGDFLTYKLTDVIISSYQNGGPNSDVPMDQFSLNFTKLDFVYRVQKADGSLGEEVSASFNFAQNKAG